ncbi:MAG: antibiotic biosynthesis monooxygenase [Pseudonocardiales bacterium]|nr:antibiotic biosynthesis monooxygenase [Pseudonocardiales bacterium]
MVVFVNQFSVHGNAEDFERAFQASSEFMRRQPGFLRHSLVRSTLLPERYVNVAEWEDAASFRRATEHPDFESHVRELHELASSEPHLCVPVLQRGALRGDAEGG